MESVCCCCNCIAVGFGVCCARRFLDGKPLSRPRIAAVRTKPKFRCAKCIETLIRNYDHDYFCCVSTRHIYWKTRCWASASLLATLNRRPIRTRMVPLDAGRNSKTKKVGPGSWTPIGNLQGAPKRVQIGTNATFWATAHNPF
jgi:hypothetical protein